MFFRFIASTLCGFSTLRERDSALAWDPEVSVEDVLQVVSVLLDRLSCL
jgi:hypothetical protein